MFLRGLLLFYSFCTVCLTLARWCPSVSCADTVWSQTSILLSISLRTSGSYRYLLYLLNAASLWMPTVILSTQRLQEEDSRVSLLSLLFGHPKWFPLFKYPLAFLFLPCLLSSPLLREYFSKEALYPVNIASCQRDWSDASVACFSPMAAVSPGFYPP